MDDEPFELFFDPALVRAASERARALTSVRIHDDPGAFYAAARNMGLELAHALPYRSESELAHIAGVIGAHLGAFATVTMCLARSAVHLNDTQTAYNLDELLQATFGALAIHFEETGGGL